MLIYIVMITRVNKTNQNPIIFQYGIKKNYFIHDVEHNSRQQPKMLLKENLDTVFFFHYE
jgi:hypothetical protein